MLQKWICNKCGFEINKKPENKNSICEECKKGRFKCWNLCQCGKWFHSQTTSQKYCSKQCGYKYKSFGGKKGKHYPHTQRARIGVCIVCGKEFRALKDYKNRTQKYCSKECWSHRGRKNKKIDRSPEFRLWKSSVLKRDNYTCQNCGAKTNLEAHHIKEVCNYPELKYEIENGVCLCNTCHRKTENYGYKARKIKKQKENK